MTNYRDIGLHKIAQANLDTVMAYLATTRIRPADSTARHYLKWDRPDGGYVIFRASCAESFGSLDVSWRCADGGFDGIFAPKRYAYLPWIARDLDLLLVDGEISREVIRGLAKPSLPFFLSP